MICKILLLFLSLIFANENFGLSKSEMNHLNKYSKSYKKIITLKKKKLFLKNRFAGEPAFAPNHLYAVLICGQKKTKTLFNNHNHCGLEKVTEENGTLTFHFLDIDHEKGLCLKRRKHRVSSSCL